jgi:hypothetical protein
MAYALASHFQSTPVTSGASSTATHTPGAGNGAFLAIMFAAGSNLTIASIQNQSAASISFTEETPNNWNNASGFGQRLVWIPSFPAGTTSIVVTLSGAVSSALYFEGAEYSGLSTSLTPDATSSHDTASAAGGGNDVTSNTATPTGVVTAGGAICFGFQGSYSAFESCTAGTGFSNYLAMNPNSGVQGAGAIEDKRITTNAAVAAIFSSATTGNEYYTQMIVIDEAGTPPNVPATGAASVAGKTSVLGIGITPLTA